ncbi:MAG: GNAT family N-acetyltransferase, partial [Algoriella sp.]|nr:GNAT family N-acetyltransferase [Algoriella sp.]
GIASELLVEIEKIALKNNEKQLFSDVSITAKSFFMSHGFDVLNSQKVIRKNVELTNFKMSKNLF